MKAFLSPEDLADYERDPEGFTLRHRWTGTVHIYSAHDTHYEDEYGEAKQ